MGGSTTASCVRDGGGDDHLAEGGGANRDGLADGGRETARAKLEAVWLAISKTGLPDVARLNPFFAGLARVPSCVLRIYGRPQVRTFREDATPG